MNDEGEQNMKLEENETAASSVEPRSFLDRLLGWFYFKRIIVISYRVDDTEDSRPVANWSGHFNA